jgi:hypothetical protein
MVVTRAEDPFLVISAQAPIAYPSESLDAYAESALVALNNASDDVKGCSMDGPEMKGKSEEEQMRVYLETEAQREVDRNHWDGR